MRIALIVIAIVAAVAVAAGGLGFVVWRGMTEPSPFAGYVPTTAKKAEEAGERIAAEFTRGECAAFDALLPMESLMRHVLHDSPMPRAQRDAVIRGAADAQSRNGTMGRQTLAQWGGRAETRLLRVRVDPDGHHVLLRLLGSGGVNYFDLTLRQDAAGQLHAVELFNHVAGMTATEILRGALMPALAADRTASLGLGGDTATRDAMARLPDIQRQMRSGQAAQALSELRAMPSAVRDLRMMTMLRLQCAQAAGDADYRSELDELERRFADSEVLALARLDGCILREQWDRAVHCLDNLARAIGGDAYLDAMAGAMLAKAGDRDSARRRGDAALEVEPETQAIWWQVVTASLDLEDHERTARLLGEMERRFALSFDNLEHAEPYRAFVASPHYRTWKAAHAAH